MLVSECVFVFSPDLFDGRDRHRVVSAVFLKKICPKLEKKDQFILDCTLRQIEVKETSQKRLKRGEISGKGKFVSVFSQVKAGEPQVLVVPVLDRFCEEKIMLTTQCGRRAIAGTRAAFSSCVSLGGSRGRGLAVGGPRYQTLDKSR